MLAAGSPDPVEPAHFRVLAFQKSATFIDQTKPGADEINPRIRFEIGNTGLQPGGFEHVVGIQNRDEVTIFRGEGDAVVDGVVRTRVGLRYQVDSFVRKLPDLRYGAVHRSVVDDDDAIDRTSLRHHRTQRFADESFMIVKWDDDGERHSRLGL